MKSGNKKVKLTSADAKVIELTEDRALFGRMVIISRRRLELNIKETIAEFELSVVHRYLFASDGSMHHCSAKSNLMSLILEKAKSSEGSIHGSIGLENVGSVVIVDAMAEVQSLEKSDEVQNCADLADAFTQKLFERYGPDRYKILYLVFDRYDMNSSLKQSTRKRRQGGKDPTAY